MNTFREQIPSRRDIIQAALIAVLKLFVSYVVVAVWALFTGFNNGFLHGDTLFLLIGAVLSFVGCAIHAWNIDPVMPWSTTKMVKSSFLGLWLVLSFLFDMYLVFYSGLWSLHTLLDSFSILTIVRSAVFTGAGVIATIAVGDLMQIERFANRQLDADGPVSNKSNGKI